MGINTTTSLDPKEKTAKLYCRSCNGAASLLVNHICDACLSGAQAERAGRQDTAWTRELDAQRKTDQLAERRAERERAERVVALICKDCGVGVALLEAKRCPACADTWGTRRDAA